MTMADDIRSLRDRVLTDLNAAHDYYTDTKIAWDIVRRVITAGHTFSIRNMTTGTVTTQADLAGKARGYVAEQLAEATFQRFVSTFEIFLFDFMRLWLAAYPQSLGGKKVEFQEVLDAPDKDAITFLVGTAHRFWADDGRCLILRYRLARIAYAKAVTSRETAG